MWFRKGSQFIPESTTRLCFAIGEFDFSGISDYRRGGSKGSEFAAYKPLFLLTNPLRQDTLHKDFILSVGYTPLHEAAEQGQAWLVITLVNHFCG